MLTCDAAQLDASVFRGAGWKAFAGGLKDTKFDLKGWWQASTPDSADSDLFPDLGTGSLAATVAAAETEAGPAWMWQLAKLNVQMFGKIGDLAPLGSGCNLGAVSATLKLYATFHVFGTPGTTITVVIESAAASNFAGATTRATIGPLTTAGGTWLTPVAGAVTDTWWRLRVTAITGTFTVAGAIGIQ